MTVPRLKTPSTFPFATGQFVALHVPISQDCLSFAAFVRYALGSSVKERPPPAGEMPLGARYRGGTTMALPFKLVSADSHIVEPPDLWLKRLDRKYQDRAPRLVYGKKTD